MFHLLYMSAKEIQLFGILCYKKMKPGIQMRIRMKERLWIHGLVAEGLGNAFLWINMIFFNGRSVIASSQIFTK